MTDKVHARLEMLRDSEDAPSRIVHRLIKDATGRRGWRQEWDQMDDDIKHEIINVWLATVRDEMGPAHD